MGRRYRIRELAEHCGVSTRTVDYYTQLGLIEPADRSGGNYRLYDESAAVRLRLVKDLQTQRFSLHEIQARLQGPAAEPGGDLTADPAIAALDRVRNELAQVERELQELGGSLTRRPGAPGERASALHRVANDALVRALAVAQVLGTIANDSLVGRL